MQLQTLTCLWVKCSAIESSLHQSLDANATLTFMCVCINASFLCVLVYVCAFVFSLSVGAECTASWEEGCFVQEWAIYSWLFPQQQIIGCSTVIQTTSCIRDCGDTACLENASHTPTALVRFTVQQSHKQSEEILSFHFFIVCDKQLKFIKHILVVSNLCFKLLFPRPSIPLWIHYSCIANKLVMITWPLTFWPLCVFTAYWDATRAFMILSLLACFFGIILGIMAFIHYSSFDRFDKTFAAGILFFISCKLTFLLVLYLILKKKKFWFNCDIF